MEEELMGVGPKDHTHIIKGKRTKRQRLQSPIPLSIATPKSSSGDADNAYSSAEFTEGVTTEEEEEDLVANCLILLAQGRSIHRPKSSRSTVGLRFTSKRFSEAPSTGSGKVGMFVYQCKTCDRTFPTFQALGGHRASHKRPKQAVVEVKKKKMLLLSHDDDDDEEEEGEIKDHTSYSLSLQFDNKPNCNTKSSPKVHECSICGAEFLSGQALGGHMRRHRASGGTNTTLSLSPLSPIGCECEDHREAKKQRTPFSLNPIGCESEDQEARKQRIVLSLDLDLNLPAPVDDQLGESKYAFTSEQRQSPPVLPTGPTWVDCQY